jgi:hypothetical protein
LAFLAGDQTKYMAIEPLRLLRQKEEQIFTAAKTHPLEVA